MTERKRSKAEERSYAALLRELEDLQADRELARDEKWNRDRKLKEAMLPGGWRTVEREVPVRPKRVRVNACYDAEVVRWFRVMGHGYQARMNAVLRAFMLAMKAREIDSCGDLDWKGDPI